MITRMLPFCAAVAALWAAVLLNPAEAQVPSVPTNESRIDPQADQVLRQMVEFCKSLKSASVEITTEYQGDRYKFGPDDRISDIYRACYPRWKFWQIGDSMEVESLMLDLKRQFGIELEAWWPEISLGDLVGLVAKKRISGGDVPH